MQSAFHFGGICPSPRTSMAFCGTMGTPDGIISLVYERMSREIMEVNIKLRLLFGHIQDGVKLDDIPFFLKNIELVTVCILMFHKARDPERMPFPEFIHGLYLIYEAA